MATGGICMKKLIKNSKIRLNNVESYAACACVAAGCSCQDCGCGCLCTGTSFPQVPNSQGAKNNTYNSMISSIQYRSENRSK